MTDTTETACSGWDAQRKTCIHGHTEEDSPTVMCYGHPMLKHLRINCGEPHKPYTFLAPIHIAPCIRQVDL